MLSALLARHSLILVFLSGDRSCLFVCFNHEVSVVYTVCYTQYENLQRKNLKVLLLKKSRLFKNIRLIAFLNAASHTTCRLPVCG